MRCFQCCDSLSSDTAAGEDERLKKAGGGGEGESPLLLCHRLQSDSYKRHEGGEGEGVIVGPNRGGSSHHTKEKREVRSRALDITFKKELITLQITLSQK